MKEAIHFKSTPSPRFRYTPCIKTGPFYEFSGMIGLTSAGLLASGGVAAEAQQILTNLKRATAEIGLTLNDMIAAQIYTTRFDEFSEINRIWETFISPDVVPPTRTSVGVSALPLNALVEMSFRFYRE
jgi:2-iminobutanoate/2-iminopropanoate deaminase